MLIRTIIAGLTALIASGLIFLSVSIQYQFGLFLDPNQPNILFARAFGVADTLKACLPFFILWCYGDRRWAGFFSSLIVFLILSVFSLTSSYSLSALNRTSLADNRANQINLLASYRSQQATLKKRLNQPLAISKTGKLNARLTELRAAPRWQSTRSCSNATVSRSIAFCNNYTRLESQLATARNQHQKRLAERQSWQTAYDTLASKIQGHLSSPHSRSSAPHFSTLSKFTGLSIETLRFALNLLFALSIELGSGWGLFIALSIFNSARPVVNAPPAFEAANENTPGSEPQQLLAAEPGQALADPGLYFDDNIRLSNGQALPAVDVYEHFRSWCDAHDFAPISVTAFGLFFAEKVGIEKVKQGGRIIYLNISFRDPVPAHKDAA